MITSHLLKTPNGFALLLGIFLILILSACGVDLAGDITPPPGSQSQSASQPAVNTIAYPLVPPDPSLGQAIYNQNCSPCHGTTGQGDGPQAGNLPNPVIAIGQASIARASIPSDWFQIITNGNISRYMPGFISGLDDSQRWDVLAYVYSLNMSPDLLAQGQKVYTANCASCHGNQGKGDGPQNANLAVKAPDITAQNRLAQKSDNDLFGEIKQGIGQGSSLTMPAFSTNLSDAEIWAVTSYIRALTFANLPSLQLVVAGGSATPQANNTTISGTSVSATSSPVTGTQQISTVDTTTVTSSTSAVPESTPTAQDTPSITGTTPPANASGTLAPTGRVHGKLILPADVSLPSGLGVSLTGFDSNVNQVSSASTPVQPDGTFQFSDVSMPSGVSFAASVVINKVTFNSAITPGQAGTDLSLDITVYDTSIDPSPLVVDRLHIFFDFSTPGIAQIVELYIISNPTTKAIVPNNGTPVMTFDLPQNATNLQFQDGTLGQRYLQTSTGFGDTQAILPGSGQFQELFAFDIAYAGTADVSLPVSLPVTAAVVLLPETGVKLNSGQLADSGQQSVQGQNFHIYTTSNLPGKTNLTMSISGIPGTSTATSGSPNSLPNLMIGGGIFLIALVVAGTFFYRSRRKNGRPIKQEEEPDLPDEDVDSLIDAIAALDDLHKAGKLPTAAYEQRRAEMKERLKKRIQETGTVLK